MIKTCRFIVEGSGRVRVIFPFVVSQKSTLELIEILLSGFIFPITSMPLPLQIISNIIPAKWFIIIVKGIMLKGVGLSFIWKETLILVGMTLFFIVLSTKKYKIRLE